MFIFKEGFSDFLEEEEKEKLADRINVELFEQEILLEKQEKLEDEQKR